MTGKKKAALFLDRDGVINHVVSRGENTTAPWNFKEFQLIEGIVEFVEKAKQLGYLIAVVTNQPDIAHGRLQIDELNLMHAEVSKHLIPDALEVCTSSDNADRRRKPNPGMITDVASRLQIDLTRSFMLGDRDKDIEAGRRAGCKTILFLNEHNIAIEKTADFDCRGFEMVLKVLNEGAKL